MSAVPPPAVTTAVQTLASVPSCVPPLDTLMYVLPAESLTEGGPPEGIQLPPITTTSRSPAVTPPGNVTARVAVDPELLACWTNDPPRCPAETDGVTAADAADGVPAPAELFAVTEKV